MRYNQHIKLYISQLRNIFKSKKLLLLGFIAKYFGITTSLPFAISTTISLGTISYYIQWEHTYNYSKFDFLTDVVFESFPIIALAIGAFLLGMALFGNAFNRAVIINETQKESSFQKTITKTVKNLGISLLLIGIFFPIKLSISLVTQSLLILILIGWVAALVIKSSYDVFESIISLSSADKKQNFSKIFQTGMELLTKDKKRALKSILIAGKVNLILFIFNSIFAGILIWVSTYYTSYRYNGTEMIELKGLDLGIILIVLFTSISIRSISALVNSLFLNARDLYLKKIYFKK